MSNNKQTMKLYTEEHLKIFYHLGKIDGFIGRQDDVDELIKNYPPIELPSDEGIKKIMELDDMEFDEFDPYHVSHLDGAKWMRDKIQGGIK
jgi:hypothetical protein